MRLSKPLSLAVTAAAALASVPAAQVSAQVSAQALPEFDPGRPTCVASKKGEFPVRTRIHGGPDAYDAGGGYRTWYIDLTNTTRATCADIHPVVVLVDEKRALEPEQPRLEFYDGERPRPVTFERTDEDEHIGVLGSAEDQDLPGFTVAPGKTLSVKVRLAVTSDAVPNDVVANAAVVQRHDDDGAWVGQSNDYRFRIVDGGEAAGKSEKERGRRGDARDRERGRDRDADGDGDGDGVGVGDRDRDRDRQGASGGVPDEVPFAEEMAGTGLSSPRAVLAAAVGALLLLGAGAAALIVARRKR
ncbi:putative membrane protein [Streptomyces aurantiacus]|uniref:hypothetical protein n=1 Tax=Streptomyces aurantiacus TaxID=47760 RepID=UPI0027904BD7|nr:hypothetical protein [Streptomyces aurantiacus]MDQ0777007.1 putative membrane protein [Streptomyces aurantiacus]